MWEKDEVVFPSTLCVVFQRSEELCNVVSYKYRDGVSGVIPTADAGCIMCTKPVKEIAEKARTNCVHYSTLACLSYMAICVTKMDQDGVEDFLFPGVELCVKFQVTIPWVTEVRLIRALAVVEFITKGVGSIRRHRVCLVMLHHSDESHW